MVKNKKKYINLVAGLGVLLLFGCKTQTNDTAIQKIVPECQAEGGCEDVVIGSLIPEEFKAKFDSGEYDLVDIRTHDEYVNERIADVPNIDIYGDDFAKKLNYLDKDKKYLIYCRSGNRTQKGLEYMKNLGFKEVYDLDGGINAWKAKGYPTKQGL